MYPACGRVLQPVHSSEHHAGMLFLNGAGFRDRVILLAAKKTPGQTGRFTFNKPLRFIR